MKVGIALMGLIVAMLTIGCASDRFNNLYFDGANVGLTIENRTVTHIENVPGTPQINVTAISMEYAKDGFMVQCPCIIGVDGAPVVRIKSGNLIFEKLSGIDTRLAIKSLGH